MCHRHREHRPKYKNNHHHPNHHNHFSRSSLRPALGLRQSLKITTNAMYRCKQGPWNTIRRHKSIRLYNTMQYNALPCNTNPFAKPHFSLGSLDHSSHSSLGLRAPVMHWTSAYKKVPKIPQTRATQVKCFGCILKTELAWYALVWGESAILGL